MRPECTLPRSVQRKLITNLKLLAKGIRCIKSQKKLFQKCPNEESNQENLLIFHRPK